MMKKYSANYSHTNHNFVIQNLSDERIENEYLSAICIVKNILQRGKPTLMSGYLQEQLGKIHREENFEIVKPLISKETPVWTNTILGAEEDNFFPAQTFFDNLPSFFPEYPFIQQLLIPELEINKVTMIESTEFINQSVDFYLPQAYLIIEIDGSHHLEEAQIIKDRQRDAYAARYRIKTVRISVKDLVARNDAFRLKIAEIKTRIETVKLAQDKRRERDTSFFSIEDYQQAYEEDIDIENSHYKATAIIRFQILILELLERGILNFTENWNLAIYTSDIQPSFQKLAIEDLFTWFEHIFQLQKTPFTKPNIELIHCENFDELSVHETPIKIDFSLLKRYTDEHLSHSNIIFVRNDYLEEYFLFENNGDFIKYRQYDYFQISTATIISYRLELDKESKDRKSLKFLLYNLFLQGQEGLSLDNIAFRQGQLPIIANVLSRKDTIGLLPTGSGKSVCYQLAAILQPAVSFVVCPIKSLMYDQKADLDMVGFTRTNHISSDNKGLEKSIIQQEFGQGKYFFIFISPERFQIKTFRAFFTRVYNKFAIAYSIIDEVHCLSEWGHDFRTSYLNLANTINTLCPSSKYLGLTATASVNVLKDIQIEFGISQENVMTPINYTREELEFIIIDDEHNKLEVIKSELEDLQIEMDALVINEENTNCGIIFTPNVTGARGCYNLSQQLGEHFDADVRFYSGAVPNVFGHNLMPRDEYDNYKKKAQNDFKNNEYSLLTATKAFGMGINKGNIHYTFHYGIPSSMEALYQEAGRAGRDKKRFKRTKAKCFVLLSKSTAGENLKQVWHRNTSLSRLQEIMPIIQGDINSNLFLFSVGMDTILEEFQNIKQVYNTLSVTNVTRIVVNGEELDLEKSKLENAIYRLHQLGVIKDWTIENFFGGGVFEIERQHFNKETIRDALLANIHKYDKEFSLEKVINNEEERYRIYRRILVEAPPQYTIIDKYIFLLLQWSYNNFAYNRRQSLKNIYENCCDYTEGTISPEEFKIRLENYFKFTQTTYVLQHIAEHPTESAKWFDVFYKIISDKREGFINKQKQKELRDNLSRLLESYRNNTGLDLISGLVRLLLNDYDNPDGKARLEGALSIIKKYSKKKKNELLKEIFAVGNLLEQSDKELLAQSIYKYFNTEADLFQIHENLGDTFSINVLLSLASQKLQQINSKLNGPLKEIEDA